MLPLSLKALFSAAAIALTLLAFFPYIRSILRGQTKPHVFTWIIWGSTTFVIFLAQLQGNGGVGAWPVGVSGVITIGIAILAYLRRGDISINRLDWFFFSLAFLALPLWFVTKDPLSAVIILTFVDILGFGPLFRKVYTNPHSESVLFFAMMIVRNSLVIAALETWSLTTVLFPAAVGVAVSLLLVLMMYRRITL